MPASGEVRRYVILQIIPACVQNFGRMNLGRGGKICIEGFGRRTGKRDKMWFESSPRSHSHRRGQCFVMSQDQALQSDESWEDMCWMFGLKIDVDGALSQKLVLAVQLVVCIFFNLPSARDAR